jgi:signal transduction histidine kinase
LAPPPVGSAALLIWTWLLLARIFPGAQHYIPVSMTVVLLVAIATLPLRPGHTLALGISIETLGLASWVAAVRSGWYGYIEWDAAIHFYDLMVLLVCTALTALMYAQRRSEHAAHQRALAAAEQVVRAQSRASLAESTNSLGRLASGLLHELNSPIGVLSSGIKTLIILAHRLNSSSEQGRQRLLPLQSELHTTLLESIDRLELIVTRVRSISSLDEAQLQATNLNELLAGIANLYADRARQRAIEVDLDLQPLPPLACRPQQISAAFTVLFNNAVNAISGSGRIRISSSRSDSRIEVRLEDNGRGIPPDKLNSIFNPTFTVTGGRVEARNWGLFTARQIVLSHGGEIEFHSQAERGTSVIVRLPA